jgi:hypothetical protein
MKMSEVTKGAGILGVPGGQDFVLLHLVESLAGLDLFLDHGAGLLEHFGVLADLVEVGELAVAGDDFHVGRQHRDDLLASGDHALHAAAGSHVDEGIAVAYVVVAHVHDVGFGEEDDGVAVGVTSGKLQRANVLAVEVDGDVVIEGNDGQSAQLMFPPATIRTLSRAGNHRL